MWELYEENDRFYHLRLRLFFNDIEELDEFTCRKLKFNFGLQCRLVGNPFLDVSLDGRRIAMEEAPYIFPILLTIMDKKRIDIECYTYDAEIFETIRYDLTEFQLDEVRYLLGICRFQMTYGFWPGENDYGI